MILFREGGSSLYRVQRPRVRPITLILIVAAFFLAACGAEIASQNWAGVSTDGEQVYVAYGNGVAAVDPQEQQLQWTFPDELGPGLLFFAPPSVSDSRIILGDFGAAGGMFSPRATITIYALGKDGGGTPPVLWTRDDLATDRIIAPALQANGQVFVGTADNHLYALDAESGELQWEFATEHSVWAQPVYSEGFVYVASLDNNVYALDPDNGDLKWQTTLGGSVAGTPVLVDDLLYVPSFDRKLHALNAQTGEEIWAADAENWVWGAPAAGNGTVFFGDIDGNIYAVSAESGEQQWSSTAGGAIQSALLYDDGVLFVTSGQTEGDEEDRRGEVLALDAEQGDVLWQYETRSPVFSAPVLVNESIAVVYQAGQASMLNVFDRENGAVTWEFELPSES